MGASGHNSEASDDRKKGITRQFLEWFDKQLQATPMALPRAQSKYGLRSGYVQKGVTSMRELWLRSMIWAAIWMNAAHEALGSPEFQELTVVYQASN